jgi:hypothetical protein
VNLSRADRPTQRPLRRRGRTSTSARAAIAAVVGLCFVLGTVGPASSAPDAVRQARAALAAATADRVQAEQRVAEAEAEAAQSRSRAEELGQLDATLTAEVADARRELREYAIAAYIDGGQSEVFRATLSLEQAQALAWQSSLLLGQSVSADEAADRFESLREANGPAVLDAATAVDRADAELTEARYDLIQAAAFERDAEAALAAAVQAAEAEAAARREEARRAAAEAAAARAAAAAAAPVTAPSATPSAPAPVRAPAPAPPSGAAPGLGNPTAAESATLARIRQCESRGNYSIVSASGRYRGAYQFDVTTWRGVGGTGDPAAASPAEQDYRALLLLRLRGTRPWPICGR